MKVHTPTVGTRTVHKQMKRTTDVRSPVVFKGHQHSIRAGEQDEMVCYAMPPRRDLLVIFLGRE